MNVMTEQCLDDVLVIDDFNLEGTRAEVLQKMKLMRGLIRGYSDKTPRTKYGGNDNIKQYKRYRTGYLAVIKKSDLSFIGIVGVIKCTSQVLADKKSK